MALEAHIDMVSFRTEVGTNWFVVDTLADDVDSVVEALQMYGEEVIGKWVNRGTGEQKRAWSARAITGLNYLDSTDGCAVLSSYPPEEHQ